MIRFRHDNKTFELEFERKKEEVDLVRRCGKTAEAKVKRVTSKYPYTTARLYLRTGEARTQLAMGKAGCAPEDVFTKSGGRLTALKILSQVLHVIMRNDPKMQKELTGKMWEAYLERGRKTPKPEPPILLPASTTETAVQ